MARIRTAVLGASGYSGEELLRLLLRHPDCEIRIITSRQNAGAGIETVFPRFAGSGLTFSNPDADKIASECSAAFLALPHGLAAEFALPLLKKGLKVFDLSADFRINNPQTYKKYYKEEHPAPELLSEAVYGLPEIYRQNIKNAKLVACPGCYPTSILLALAPLLKEGIISEKGIVVSSMSGVSGAGRKVDLQYIFPECNESLRAYSPSAHRHLPEIEQELAKFAGVPELKINFIPHLVPVNRGINSTIIASPKRSVSESDIASVYSKYYANEKFVRVLPPRKMPDTKYVTMSNICEIGFCLDEHTGNLIVASCIDNLTKGAAGQAVQCFNIAHGIEEHIALT